TGSRRNFYEYRALQIEEQQQALSPRHNPVLLVDTQIDMPIDDEDIEQSVVVIVQKTGAPAQKRDRRVGNPRGKAHVGEAGFPVIAVKGVVVIGKICDVQID